MKHFTVLPILFLVVAGCAHKSSPSAPQGPAKGPVVEQYSFEGADRNADSVLSKQEIDDAFSAAFARLDKNKDSFLYGDEIPANFRQADHDKDSKISIYEYMNAVDDQYTAVKKKPSLYLTKDEAKSLAVPK